MKADWKDIPELDNLYKINSDGVVMSKDRKVKSSIQKTGYRLHKGKIKHSQDNGNGYKQIYVQINKRRKILYIHRLVAQAFIPNPENKPNVNHINGIKSDNCVENLEWCTQAENQNHASENNLLKKGEKSSLSKITKNQVLAIRRLNTINPKFNKSKVAVKLGIRDSTIHKIINRQIWKHI